MTFPIQFNCRTRKTSVLFPGVSENNYKDKRNNIDFRSRGCSMKSEKPESKSRREFVRKAAYVAPAIVTLSVLPAHQALGSGGPNGRYGNPPGNPNKPGRPF